jgi:hypothetical protein
VTSVSVGVRWGWKWPGKSNEWHKSGSQPFTIDILFCRLDRIALVHFRGDVRGDLRGSQSLKVALNTC